MAYKFPIIVLVALFIVGCFDSNNASVKSNGQYIYSDGPYVSENEK